MAENRPFISYGDRVYLRPQNNEGLECCGAVHGVNLRRSPKIFLSVPLNFLFSVFPFNLGIEEGLKKEKFHVRFTLDPLPFEVS